MFYVLGINGPMAQSGTQRLSHITSVRGVQRPSGLRAGASGVEGREAQVRQAAPQLSPRAQGAVSAYLSTEQGPKQERRQLYVVSDVMTRGAVTLAQGLSVERAWQILSEKKIAQAPVVNTAGIVVGLLLRADIAPQSWLPTPDNTHALQAQAQRLMAEVMITPVPAVSEDTDLRNVTHVLLETGLPGLPVTDAAGTLSGFISRTDILRAVASEPPLDLWS